MKRTEYLTRKKSILQKRRDANIAREQAEYENQLLELELAIQPFAPLPQAPEPTATLNLRIGEMIANLPLTASDRELLELTWLTTRQVAEYFEYPDKDATRQIRIECDRGVYFTEQSAKNRTRKICARSCVLKMHGIPDPRLANIEALESTEKLED